MRGRGLVLGCALGLFVVGCGDDGATADAGDAAVDAADARLDSRDASPDAPDGSTPDADASCDPGSRTSCGCASSCGARELCDGVGCSCAPGDVLCDTRGYASFAMPDPSRGGAPYPADYRVDVETVEDLVTGFIWERGASEAKETFADAAARCATLSLAGRDDFRLPSRVELASILDPTRTPSIDRDAFGATPEDYFWTSSLVPGTDGFAYGLYFGGGEMVTARMDTPGAYVRCVAGPVGATLPTRHVVSAISATDLGTGLVWSRLPLGPLANAEAAATCAALDLDGMPGRVPTINELATTVDEGRAAPALDPDVYEAGADAAFWSSTTRDLGAVVAWVLDAREGETRLVDLDEAHYLRCVR